jgi:hypothetical protein
VGLTTEKITISGMITPLYTGSMSGIIIEYLDAQTPRTLETYVFTSGAPTISVNSLTATLTGKDAYYNSNTTYTMKINVNTIVNSQAKLYVNFTSSWNLFSTNCTIVLGIPGSPICRLASTTSYVIENFQQLSPSSQIILQFKLNTPTTAGSYSVGISTFETAKWTNIDSGTATAVLNATLGTTANYAVRALTTAIRVTPFITGQTVGPLEMTLYLKNDLVATNVIQLLVYP